MSSEIEDLLGCCRICGSPDQYANLFYKINKILLRNLSSLLETELTQSDGFSKWVCKACVEHVEVFMTMRQNFQETSEKFQSLVDSTFKSEISQNPVVETFIAEVENEEVETISYQNQNQELIEPEDVSEEENEQIEPNYSEPTENRLMLTSFHCPKCEKSFPYSANLVRHIKSAHENLRYCCTMCSGNYTQKSTLKDHMKKMHNVDSDLFYCKTEAAGKNSSKSQEQADEAQKYRKQCSTCGVFVKNLSEHRLTHSDKKLFRCTFPSCKKEFKFKTSLTIHINDHKHGRKFSCTEPGCDKKFRRSHHLKEHLFTHSNEKNFCCKELGCGKKFKSKLNLYKHTKIHS